MSRIRARGRARAVASLVYGSVALDFLVAFIFTLSLFLNNAPRYRMAALLLFYVIFIPLIVFIIIGAANLTNTRGRGLVMTGGIMALIAGGLLVIWCLILLMAILRIMALGITPPFWILIIFLVYVGGAALSIIAGVKVLMVICNPDVRACFPGYEEYPEPRRRRPRREDDDYDRDR